MSKTYFWVINYRPVTRLHNNKMIFKAIFTLATKTDYGVARRWLRATQCKALRFAYEIVMIIQFLFFNFLVYYLLSFLYIIM